MKGPILIPTLIFGLLLVLILAGPRFILKAPPTELPVLPEDLDAYLQASEAKIKGLKPGVEKKILWANEDQSKTRYSVIYIHGFSSSHKELSPCTESIAKQLGANLFLTRLTGHGTKDGEAMGDVGAADWMQDCLEAAAIGERIGDELIIIGTSHGGLLTTWLSTQSQTIRTPKAQILISPNYGPKDERTTLLSLPWAEQILIPIFGNYQHWEAQNSGHEYYWNTRYPTRATLPMMAQVNWVTRNTLGKPTVPTLVFYSEKDQTVNPEMIKDGYEKLLAEPKKLIAIENSNDKKNHVLAGEILSSNTSDLLIHESLLFLNSL